MQSVAFALPVLVGRSESQRLALASCRDGWRKEAYEDARRRAGIVREAVWLQPGPTGDLTVIYLDADDLTCAITQFARSAEPFDRWFRNHVREVHGVAHDDEFPMPELLLDFDTERI